MRFDSSHDADIITYYHTNYSGCIKQDSFFATSHFLVTFTHSVMIVQVPLALLTAYCILKKTPNVIKDSKWAMLNVHIWITFVDVFFSSLATPYIFFPAIGGFPVGLLRTLGVPTAVQVFIGVILIGVMFSSICALFENRSSSFALNSFRIEKNNYRVAFFIINTTLFAAFMAPVFLTIPEQNSAKMTWLVYFLICPTEEFFTSPVFILIVEKFWGYYMSFVFSAEIGAMIAFSLFFIACTSYHMFFATQVIFSANTKRLQKMFFIGNLIQIAVPALFWAAPLSCIGMLYLLNYHNQALINIGVCFACLHGVSSMIVVLVIHRPYRTFILNFFER